jgi:hypothetical protein
MRNFFLKTVKGIKNLIAPYIKLIEIKNFMHSFFLKNCEIGNSNCVEYKYTTGVGQFIDTTVLSTSPFSLKIFGIILLYHG